MTDEYICRRRRKRPSHFRRHRRENDTRRTPRSRRIRSLGSIKVR